MEEEMKLVISLLLLVISSHVYSECAIKLRVTHFPPYAIKNNDHYSGMDIELANLLLAKANCAVIYENQPWKRALFLLKNGGLDLVTGMSVTEERKTYVNFIGPMRNEEMALIVPSQSNFVIDSLQALTSLDKPIGITRGLFYGKALTDKLQSNEQFAKKFDVSDSTHNNILKLLKDRLSGVIGDRYYLTQELRKHDKLTEFKVHPFNIHKDGVFFGFSKKSVSAENLDTILQAHQRLLQSGAYQTIIDQY